MHNWNYTPDHPITLTLACDARLGPTTYFDDQIWEINLGNSEPPALTLQTTLGLRARSCRIFPRFIYNDQVLTDPASFYKPIKIHDYFPNYIKLSFMPFSCVNVSIEYWVPSSQAITGRMKISNSKHDPCSLQIEWAELLIPSGEGSIMSASEFGMTTVLSGQTAQLAPVFFLIGGAKPGKSPYPSLSLAYQIPAFGKQECSWVHATLAERNDSYETAKKIIKLNWDAEFSRIQRINSQELQIQTGKTDWDTAFALAQTLAYQLFLTSTPAIRSSSYVYARNPDNGYSSLKNGTDYNFLWNGQTVFDSYYLMNFVLPHSPELIRGLLENFLDTQNDKGEIDLKPGLGGQRSQILATPLLAKMALDWYEYGGDVEYLRLIYPKLRNFFVSWFSSSHDRDSDGIPEWDQVIQTGDVLALFSDSSHPHSSTEISTVESPDLLAYLYIEAKALTSIARLTDQLDEITQLESTAENLKSAIERSWNDQYASYLYRDRDAHVSTPTEIIGTLQGPGIMEVHRDFNLPIRPFILINTKGESTRPVQVFIHGTGANGTHRVENIPNYHVHWHMGVASTTSDYTYTSIEHIEVSGIKNDEMVIVRSVDLTSLDLSLLTPLWAGIPSSERAKILINLTIMNKKSFLSPFGLRTWLPETESDNYPDEFYGMHFPWMALIIEGMVQYGDRKKAAEVYSRMMKPVTQNIKKEMAFRQAYHCETGQILGAKNQLSGLVPCGLFLKIIGVTIVNQNEVKLSGHNPFPWPVTLKYRGLTIVREEKKTLVSFSDGQNITVDNDQSQVISIE
jgi:Mannosylglycerate hydrolase MGH1-like glycoside hydrolase domain